MKIIIKTITREQFDLDVSEDETILQVKQRIQQIQSHDPSWQKLIFSGKILEDASTLRASSVKEGDFLVLMVRKPTTPAATPTPTPAVVTPAVARPTPTQTVPTPAVTESVPSPAFTPVVPTPVVTPSVPSPAFTPVQPTQPTPTGATGGNTGAAVTGGAVSAEFQRNVNNIMEMGFPKDQVEAALRASFNNPDRAVEYLMTGIPQGVGDIGGMGMQIDDDDDDDDDDVGFNPLAGIPLVGGNIPTGGLPQGTPQGGQAQGGNFAWLLANPQFNQLRGAIQQNPQLLGPLLQQLGQANPQLLQLIAANQAEFMNVLNMPTGEGLEMGGDDDDDDDDQVDVGQTLQISQTDKDAIDRLVALGFSRGVVVQAYMACDKNEDVAANYLFDHAHELEDDQPTGQRGGQGS